MTEDKNTKEVVQAEQPVSSKISVLEMMDAYFQMTGLKLDRNCHMDSEFVEKWYNTKYITGIHNRYVLPKGVTITHYKDGIVYKNTNITDEIAERLIKENKQYKKLFIDLGE